MIVLNKFGWKQNNFTKLPEELIFSPIIPRIISLRLGGDET
jgi:hypothetical protein